MNLKVKNVGERVMKQSGIPEDEKFGSIIAILMVISIILTLIRVLQECNKNKLSGAEPKEKCETYGQEIKTYSTRRGWFTKLRIKKVLRQNMSKEQYSKYGLQLTNALLDNGENLKDDEVMALVEASNV
jgi:hypothetical protein